MFWDKNLKLIVSERNNSVRKNCYEMNLFLQELFLLFVWTKSKKRDEVWKFRNAVSFIFKLFFNSYSLGIYIPIYWCHWNREEKHEKTIICRTFCSFLFTIIWNATVSNCLWTFSSTLFYLTWSFLCCNFHKR